MERNVGSTDKLARIVLGAVLGLVGATALIGTIDLATPVAALALVVAVILIGTGLTQLCPLYRVLGVNTCERA